MKLTYTYSILAMALIALLAGCGQRQGHVCDHDHQEKLVLVNVLDEPYFRDCHIAVPTHSCIESINVPFEHVADYAAKNWDKDNTHIVLYCGNYKCTASGMAAKQLREAGYQHAWAYEGGIAEWRHLAQTGPGEYKVEGACKEVYLEDFQKPEPVGHEQEAHVITAQELKKKLDEIAKKV